MFERAFLFSFTVNLVSHHFHFFFQEYFLFFKVLINVCSLI
uniref:Uncharacterized protein n=1 Tax=Anguilla anguilla TaxID=7936 RepID=A0A0E9X883_ANGAN